MERCIEPLPEEHLRARHGKSVCLNFLNSCTAYEFVNGLCKMYSKTQRQVVIFLMFFEIGIRRDPISGQTHEMEKKVLMFHCHCPSHPTVQRQAVSPPGVLHQELSACAGRVLLIDPLSCRSSKVYRISIAGCLDPFIGCK